MHVQPMFQLKSLSVSALFLPLKASEFSYANFHIFQLHASHFSGSVKLQTLPPSLILIFTLL